MIITDQNNDIREKNKLCTLNVSQILILLSQVLFFSLHFHIHDNSYPTDIAKQTRYLYYFLCAMVR